MSAEQFYSTRIYMSKKFQGGCNMVELDLSGWDFSHFDPRHVRSDSSVVTNARFDNARGGDLGTLRG